MLKIYILDATFQQLEFKLLTHFHGQSRQMFSLGPRHGGACIFSFLCVFLTITANLPQTRTPLMSVDAYLTHTMNHIISTFIQRPELQSVVPNFAIVNAEHLYVGYIQM